MATLEAFIGDTIKFRIAVTRGGSPLNITSASFRFTARKWRTDPTPIIQKTNAAFIPETLPATGVTILTLDPADTEVLLTTTELQYDVEMTEGDGRITTVADDTILFKLSVSR